MKLLLLCPKNKEMTTARICVVPHKLYVSLSWGGPMYCHVNADEFNVNEQNSGDT
jgi:hypothetical protein